MRDLTKSEIEQAPEWAKFYSINLTGKVAYSINWSIGDELVKEKPPHEPIDTIELLQLCVNDMYSPTGRIKKSTGRKLMAACQQGIVDFPQ